MYWFIIYIILPLSFIRRSLVQSLVRHSRSRKAWARLLAQVVEVGIRRHEMIQNTSKCQMTINEEYPSRSTRLLQPFFSAESSPCFFDKTTFCSRKNCWNCLPNKKPSTNPSAFFTFEIFIFHPCLAAQPFPRLYLEAFGQEVTPHWVDCVNGESQKIREKTPDDSVLSRGYPRFLTPLCHVVNDPQCITC